MEIEEETYLTIETETDEEAILKEAWPLPLEDMVKEFEEYLLDIGIRI